MKRFALAFARLLALALACSCMPASAEQWLLHNGRIATLDSASTMAEALLTDGETIAAIGDVLSLRAQAGPQVRLVDLGGRLVIPGLIDSHIHAIRAGLTFAQDVNWTDVGSLEEALARLADAAARRPLDSWIVVPGGWNAQQFREKRLPTQAEIEQAGGGRPVYVQMSYAGVLLSQRGFSMLGLTREDDLEGSARFERDPQGQMTGWILGDLAAVVALYDRLPKPSLDEAKRGTRAFFRTLHAYGVTGVSDPGGHNLALHQYAAIQELAGEGALTMRVRYSLCAPRAGNELSDFQALTQNFPMHTGDDWLRFNGIGECVTWGLYNNDTPSDEQAAQFEEVALWAARAGLGLTVHWNNEASVHRLLDLFERVGKQADYKNLRWSIAHIHDARPQTLRRMKDLHLGWLMQNRLYFAAPAFLANYESTRLTQMPPIASARQLGVPVGGGTDADRVMSYNPFVALRWMLDGRTLAGLSTRGPQEVPSREEALRIWTQGSAWFTHEETRRGVLKPGALADLAVLSGNFFEVPVEEMAALRADLTMVGGRVVHAAGAFAPLSSQ